MTREELFANLNAGARWDVGVSINRSNSLPLDANSIFESYEAAAAYASKDDAAIASYGFLNNAYIGQIIAVVGENAVGIYYIDQNLALQPVGKEVVLDKVSVVTNESGAVQIYGFEAAAASTYPRKTADGKIEWVTISELVEGATENTVTVGDGKSVTNETTDTGYKLAIVGYADATNGQVPFASKVTNTEGQLVESLVWKDVYTKNEVDEKVAGVFSYKGAAAGAPTDEGKNILVGDTTIAASAENVGHVYIYNGKEYVSNGSIWEELGFELDLSGYYTKTETDAAIDADVKVEADRAIAAEGELSNRIAVLEGIDHTAYAKVTDLTALDGKVTTLGEDLTTLQETVDSEAKELDTLQGTVTTLSSTVDGHTSTLETLNIELAKKLDKSVYDAYVDGKTYTDTQIDEKIAALGVTALSQKVSSLDETVNGTADNASTGLVSKVATLSSKVDTNTADITSLKTTAETLSGKVATLESKDTTIEANISALQTTTDKHSALLAGVAEGTTVKTLIDAASNAAASAQNSADQANTAVANLKAQEVATNTANISNLSTRVTTIESKIDGVTGAMHFVGVKDSVPTDNTGYKSGDVILVNKKEYVFDGSIWVELGDEGSYALRTEVYTKTETDAAIAAAMSWAEME